MRSATFLDSSSHHPSAWSRHSRSRLIESSRRDRVATRAWLTSSRNASASSSRMRPATTGIRHDEQILRSRNPETKTRTNDNEYGVARSRYPFLTFLVFERRSRPVLHFFKSCPVYIYVLRGWPPRSAPSDQNTDEKATQKHQRRSPESEWGSQLCPCVPQPSSTLGSSTHTPRPAQGSPAPTAATSSSDP
jgi:hypothetical protein